MDDWHESLVLAPGSVGLLPLSELPKKWENPEPHSVVQDQVVLFPAENAFRFGKN